MAVTRTLNVYFPSAVVDVTRGDSLMYSVTVRGAVSDTFTLVDARTRDKIWSSSEGPSETQPDVVYKRKWPEVGDGITNQTSHSMGFEFIGVRQIKYVVTLHHKLGPSKTLLDIDYEATSDEDSYFEDILVTVF